MANISDAWGEIVIPKKYARGCKRLIKQYVSDYACPYYGVQCFDMSENACGDVVLTFDGAGRWAFDSCADDIDWFFYTEGNPHGEELLRRFKDKDARLYIEFTDVELGCDLLYTFKGEYKLDGGKFHLDGDYCTVPCSPEGMVELGIYDSVEEAREEYFGWCE